VKRVRELPWFKEVMLALIKVSLTLLDLTESFCVQSLVWKAKGGEREGMEMPYRFTISSS